MIIIDIRFIYFIKSLYSVNCDIFYITDAHLLYETYPNVDLDMFYIPDAYLL